MSFFMTQGLHRAVQRHPERIATIYSQRQHSYRKYAERVARLAAALQQLGMGRGDRVGILALNSDRYLEFFYGVWWGGGAVNPVNIRWSATEIAYSLDDCETRILLVDDRFAEMAADLRGRSKSLQTVVYIGDGATPNEMLNYEELLAQAAPSADVGSGGNDLAAVMYTGGTTGFPKGVMLSHDNLASNALCLAAAGGTHADGIALLIAPMFHVACNVVMNAHAAVGGTFVIAPMFTPQAALEAIQQHRVTHALLVPTMIQLATDYPEAAQYDVSSVQRVVCGARRMVETAAHLVDHVIPRVPVRQWVLSFPIPLRLLFAAHSELLAPVLRIVHRVIATFLIKQAGLERAEAATGAVTLIQRFGSAANLNKQA